MPIFEFYCPDCHTVFSFLARRAGERRVPACPKCGRKQLEKEVSLFAVPAGAEEGAGGSDDVPVDEGKMERAMASLAGEAEGLDDQDPRDAARLMRKFTDMAGMKLKGGAEEAMRRMEAGEDPEAIEAEMGDQLGAEDPFEAPGRGGGGGVGSRARGAPRRDPKLYDL